MPNLVGLFANLAGLIANIVFFIVNFRIANKDRATKEASAREDRIVRVVADYVGLATTHQDSGIHALLVAGIKELHDSDEIQDALRRITERAGAHPLEQAFQRVPRARLKAFFQEVTTQGFNTLGYREALTKFTALE